MAKFLLKPNGLKLIFDIGTPKYENFDESRYREAAKQSERLQMLECFSKAAGPFAFGITPINLENDPRNLSTNRQRWGQLKHPEYKGAIYYAFRDGVIRKRTSFAVGIYSEDSTFRKQQGGEPVIFFKGTQTNDEASIDDIRVNQTPGRPNFDMTKVDTSHAPHVKRSVLLAHRSYEQISTDQGITPEENLAWAEAMSEMQVTELYYDQFSHADYGT